MKGIAILGSTGSIGQSALAVVDAHPDRLHVVALAAGENAPRFVDQIARYRPGTIAMATEQALADVAAELLRRRAPTPRTCGSGTAGSIAVATHPDAEIVLFASSGTAGLDAVLAAIDAGKTIALANKEILVMAGVVVMEAARRRGVAVLPVDSEHNAIHQCLHGRSTEDVRRLILTASGGPFRDRNGQALETVTPDDALRHPTWRMGPKITIDSATLMNKGLEVIEARWLFDTGADRIAVVVHPQSIVHSMVEFVDGSIIAQLGVTDMRLPIQYALTYPERLNSLPRLDLGTVGALHFELPDLKRFPCLGLGYEAIRAGGTLPAVLNAADEVAVAAFLEEKIPFNGIVRILEKVMKKHRLVKKPSLAGLLEADRWAREEAEALV